jgi:NAD(P)-dependent dehydrogenase (short-subunit alcohol dehydrogenase family)
MDLGLADKKVFVTGGSSGIGRAIARTFAAEGADVAFTYFSAPEAARSLVMEIEGHGGRAHAFHMNVREHASVEAAVASAFARLGSIDVLINNALASTRSIDAEPDPGLRSWQTVLRSNLESTFYITEEVVRGMRQRGWGRVVSISSDLAQDGAKGSAPYSTAKSGLHGMTRGLCWELGPHNVLINAILPGLTETDRQRENLPAAVFDHIKGGNPTGRVSDPQDSADLAVFLSSTRNRNITGELVRVTGGR